MKWKRWMRRRKGERERVKGSVRGNIGNNMLTAVQIKSSPLVLSPTSLPHLQHTPSGRHCVIWHIHFLAWVSPSPVLSRLPQTSSENSSQFFFPKRATDWTAHRSGLPAYVTHSFATPRRASPPQMCFLTSSVEPSSLWEQMVFDLVLSSCTTPLHIPWSFSLVRLIIKWPFTGPFIPNPGLPSPRPPPAPAPRVHRRQRSVASARL